MAIIECDARRGYGTGASQPPCTPTPDTSAPNGRMRDSEPEPVIRFERLGAAPQLEVQPGTRGPHTHGPQAEACNNLIANLDVNLAQPRAHRKVAVSVIDDHGLAVWAVLVRKRNPPGEDHLDGRPDGRLNLETWPLDSRSFRGAYLRTPGDREGQVPFQGRETPGGQGRVEGSRPGPVDRCVLRSARERALKSSRAILLGKQRGVCLRHGLLVCSQHGQPRPDIGELAPELEPPRRQSAMLRQLTGSSLAQPLDTGRVIDKRIETTSHGQQPGARNPHVCAAKRHTPSLRQLILFLQLPQLPSKFTVDPLGRGQRTFQLGRVGR